MKFIIVIIISIILFGCANDLPEKKHQFTVSMKTGTGFDAVFSNIKCDSFQMISKTHIYLWIDGVKQNAIADRISINTN